MVNRVKIHIGMDKTGTTSIQKYCAANEAEIFERSGWAYYPEGRSHGHHLEIAQNLGFAWDGAATHTLASPEEVFFRAGCDKAFLSCEHFSYGKGNEAIPRLREYFRDYEVDILVYYRSLPAWFVSLYSEAVKWGSQQSFDEYYEFTKSRFDLTKFHSNWVDVFGEENVKAKNYEVEKQSLIAGFLSELGIAASEGSSEKSEAKVFNPAINMFDIKVLQKSNEILGHSTWKESIRLCWHYMAIKKSEPDLYDQSGLLTGFDHFNEAHRELLNRMTDKFITQYPGVGSFKLLDQQDLTSVDPLGQQTICNSEIDRVSAYVTESYVRASTAAKPAAVGSN